MRFALWSRLAHHYNGSLNIPTENVALPGEAANNSDEDKESEPTREHMDEPQSPSASFVNNERGTHSAHCSSVSPLSSISLESLSTPAADDQVQFSLQFATSLLTNIIPSIKQINPPSQKPDLDTQACQFLFQRETSQSSGDSAVDLAVDDALMAMEQLGRQKSRSDSNCESQLRHAKEQIAQLLQEKQKWAGLDEQLEATKTATKKEFIELEDQYKTLYGQYCVIQKEWEAAVEQLEELRAQLSKSYAPNEAPHKRLVNVGKNQHKTKMDGISELLIEHQPGCECTKTEHPASIGRLQAQQRPAAGGGGANLNHRHAGFMVEREEFRAMEDRFAQLFKRAKHLRSHHSRMHEASNPKTRVLEELEELVAETERLTESLELHKAETERKLAEEQEQHRTCKRDCQALRITVEQLESSYIALQQKAAADAATVKKINAELDKTKKALVDSATANETALAEEREQREATERYCNELRDEVACLKQDNDRFKKVVAAQTQTLADLELTTKQLNTTLNTQKTESEGHIQQEKAAREACERDCKQLQHTVDALKAEKVSLKNENRSQELKRNQLTARLQLLEEIVENNATERGQLLQEKREAQQKWETERAKLCLVMKEEQSELNCYKQDLSTLNNALKVLQDEKAALEQQCVSQRALIERLEIDQQKQRDVFENYKLEANTALALEKKEHQACLEDLNTERAAENTVRQKNEALNCELRALCETLNKERREASEAIEERNTMVDRLEAKALQLTSDAADLKAKMDSLIKEKKIQEVTYESDCKALRCSVAEEQKQREQFRRECEVLRVAMEQLEDDKTAFKNENTAQRVESEKLTAEVERLENALEKLNATMETLLASQREELSEQKKNFESLQKSMQQLEEKNSTLSQEIQRREEMQSKYQLDYQEKLKAVQQEQVVQCRKAEEKFQALQQSYAKLEATSADVHEKNAALVKRVKLAEQEASRLKDAMAQSEISYKHTVKCLEEDYTTKARVLEKNAQEREHLVTALQHSLQKSAKDTEKLQLDLASRTQRIAELFSENKTLTENKAELEDAINCVQKRLAEVEKTLQITTASVDSHREAASRWQLSYCAATVALVALRCAVDNAEAQLNAFSNVSGRGDQKLFRQRQLTQKQAALLQKLTAKILDAETRHTAVVTKLNDELRQASRRLEVESATHTAARAASLQTVQQLEAAVHGLEKAKNVLQNRIKRIDVGNKKLANSYAEAVQAKTKIEKLSTLQSCLIRQLTVKVLAEAQNRSTLLLSLLHASRYLGQAVPGDIRLCSKQPISLNPTSRTLQAVAVESKVVVVANNDFCSSAGTLCADSTDRSALFRQQLDCFQQHLEQAEQHYRAVMFGLHNTVDAWLNQLKGVKNLSKLHGFVATEYAGVPQFPSVIAQLNAMFVRICDEAKALEVPAMLLQKENNMLRLKLFQAHRFSQKQAHLLVTLSKRYSMPVALPETPVLLRMTKSAKITSSPEALERFQPRPQQLQRFVVKQTFHNESTQSAPLYCNVLTQNIATLGKKCETINASYLKEISLSSSDYESAVKNGNALARWRVSQLEREYIMLKRLSQKQAELLCRLTSQYSARAKAKAVTLSEQKLLSAEKSRNAFLHAKVEELSCKLDAAQRVSRQQQKHLMEFVTRYNKLQPLCDVVNQALDTFREVATSRNVCNGTVFSLIPNRKFNAQSYFSRDSCSIMLRSLYVNVIFLTSMVAGHIFKCLEDTQKASISSQQTTKLQRKQSQLLSALSSKLITLEDTGNQMWRRISSSAEKQRVFMEIRNIQSLCKQLQKGCLPLQQRFTKPWVFNKHTLCGRKSVRKNHVVWEVVETVTSDKIYAATPVLKLADVNGTSQVLLAYDQINTKTTDSLSQKQAANLRRLSLRFHSLWRTYEFARIQSVDAEKELSRLREYVEEVRERYRVDQDGFKVMQKAVAGVKSQRVTAETECHKAIVQEQHYRETNEVFLQAKEHCRREEARRVEVERLKEDAEVQRLDAERRSVDAEARCADAKRRYKEFESEKTKVNELYNEERKLRLAAELRIVELKKLYTDAEERCKFALLRQKTSEQQFSDVQKQYVEAQEKFVESEQERERLKQLFIEAEERFNRTETLRKEAEDRLAEVDQLATTVELRFADAENKRIVGEKLFFEAEKLRIEAEKRFTEADTLHAEAEKRFTEAETLHAEAEKRFTEVEKLRLETKQRSENAKRDSVEAEKWLAEAKRQVEELEKKGSEVQQRSVAAKMLHDEAQKKSAEVEEMRLEAEQLSAKAKTQHAEMEKCSMEAERRSAEAKKLLAEAEKERSEAKQQSAKIEALHVEADKRLVEAEKRFSEAEQRFGQIRKQQIEVDKQFLEAKTLRSEAEKWFAEMEKVRVETEQLSVEVKRQYAGAEKRFAEAEKRFAEAEKRFAEAENEQNEAKRQAAEAKALHREAEKRIMESETRLREVHILHVGAENMRDKAEKRFAEAEKLRAEAECQWSKQYKSLEESTEKTEAVKQSHSKAQQRFEEADKLSAVSLEQRNIAVEIRRYPSSHAYYGVRREATNEGLFLDQSSASKLAGVQLIGNNYVPTKNSNANEQAPQIAVQQLCADAEKRCVEAKINRVKAEKHYAEIEHIYEQGPRQRRTNTNERCMRPSSPERPAKMAGLQAAMLNNVATQLENAYSPSESPGSYLEWEYAVRDTPSEHQQRKPCSAASLQVLRQEEPLEDKLGTGNYLKKAALNEAQLENGEKSAIYGFKDNSDVVSRNHPYASGCAFSSASTMSFEPLISSGEARPTCCAGSRSWSSSPVLTHDEKTRLGRRSCSTLEHSDSMNDERQLSRAGATLFECSVLLGEDQRSKDDWPSNTNVTKSSYLQSVFESWNSCLSNAFKSTGIYLFLKALCEEPSRVCLLRLLCQLYLLQLCRPNEVADIIATYGPCFLQLYPLTASKEVLELFDRVNLVESETLKMQQSPRYKELECQLKRLCDEKEALQKRYGEATADFSALIDALQSTTEELKATSVTLQKELQLAEEERERSLSLYKSMRNALIALYQYVVCPVASPAVLLPAEGNCTTVDQQKMAIERLFKDVAGAFDQLRKQSENKTLVSNHLNQSYNTSLQPNHQQVTTDKLLPPVAPRCSTFVQRSHTVSMVPPVMPSKGLRSRPVKALIVAAAYRHASFLQSGFFFKNPNSGMLTGSSFPLVGSVHDVTAWCQLLPHLGWDPSCVRVLSESYSCGFPNSKDLDRSCLKQKNDTKSFYPTKQAILESLDWLTRDVHPGERVLLVMMGAGALLPAATQHAVVNATSALPYYNRQNQSCSSNAPAYDPCFLPSDVFCQTSTDAQPVSLNLAEREQTKFSFSSVACCGNSVNANDRASKRHTSEGKMRPSTMCVSAIPLSSILNYFHRLPRGSEATVVWDFGIARDALLPQPVGVPQHRIPLARCTSDDLKLSLSPTQTQSTSSPDLKQSNVFNRWTRRVVPRYMNIEGIVTQMQRAMPSLRVVYDLSTDSVMFSAQKRRLSATALSTKTELESCVPRHHHPCFTPTPLSCHLYLLSASKGHTRAYETCIGTQQRGVFSWALCESLRRTGFKSASETLLRANVS